MIDGNSRFKVKVIPAVAAVFAVILLLVISASPAAAEAPADWWRFHKDTESTGYSGDSGMLFKALNWKFDTGSPVGSSPAVVDSRLYIGNNAGVLYCIDALDGTEIWNKTLCPTSGIEASPAVYKGVVYVGDGGYAELSDPTQRLGLDLEIRYRIKPWLWLDADLCWSEGKVLGLPDNENYIPLAPRLTSNGGITVKDFYGFDAALRYIYVDDRPANEQNTVIAEGYTILNVGIIYHWNELSFSLTLENLANAEWKEAQFDTESRLMGEPEPVSENHFTPGNPRNIQAGISYRF